MWTAKLLCCLLLVPFAQAGTFLSGSLRWQHLGDSTVNFDIVTYWRRSFTPFQNGQARPGDKIDLIAQSTVSFRPGDGSREQYLFGQVTEINEAEDWLEAVSTIQYKYGDPDLSFDGQVIPWEASLQGCCRFLGDEGPSNDLGGDFLVKTTVNLAVGASPDLRAPPMVYMKTGSSFRVPAPITTRTPQTVPNMLFWRFCTGTQPLAESLIQLNETTGVLTWTGATSSKYAVCVEARRYMDLILGTHIYAQQDFMIVEQDAAVAVPAVTLLGMDPAHPLIYGYVGYRFNFTVVAELAGAAQGDLGVSLGYKSRAADGATNMTGMAFKPEIEAAGRLQGLVEVEVVADWNAGWYAICLFAYLKSDPMVASTVQCVDAVFSTDTRPIVTVSSHPRFRDPLGRPDVYSVAEGQELQVSIRAFKPPVDDVVTVELSSGPPGARIVVKAVGHSSLSQVAFTPARELAGASIEACVVAKGSRGAYRVVDTAELCLTIDVKRCVWTVREAESLVSISQILGVSWLQLWNFNKANISRPDFDLQMGQLINVGQLYAVDQGDTLYNLAERFSTTIDMLERMNADVADSKQLVANANPPQLLCITFNSCNGPSVQ